MPTGVFGSIVAGACQPCPGGAEGAGGCSLFRGGVTPDGLCGVGFGLVATGGGCMKDELSNGATPEPLSGSSSELPQATSSSAPSDDRPREF